MRFETALTTPFGPIRIVTDGIAITRVDFEASSAHDEHPLLSRAANALEAYLSGRSQTFEVPLAPEGTAFQRAVWTALTTIPFGETRTYTDVARAVGRPAAVRAVGAANGRNPLAIVVPCHRVIGANGTLTGYAGGLAAKLWLLEHERRTASRHAA